MTETVRTAPAPAPLYGPGYKAAVLSLLLLAYTFNFIDRTIVSTIGQAIKTDLKITDTQLGLLGGLYFALLYTVLGIPIARWAERSSRTWIITGSLVIWSGFTALCGLAQNFGQLSLLRFGVGIGEAGCSPASHSLISDYYPPRRRASALSVYSFGIPLGTMFGAIAGGWLAQHVSWRAAFMVVGLPGLILALVFRLVVKEPRRGASDIPEHPVLVEDVGAPLPAPGGLRHELSEIGAVTKALFGRWPVLNMVLGITLVSFSGYGAGAFLPPFLVRNFGLGLAEVGLALGLAAGLAAGLGTLAGGFVTDRLSRRSARWYALVPAIGLTLATPLFVLAFSQSDWRVLILIYLAPLVLTYTYLGPTFAVVQNAVDVRRRATAVAVLFFFLNLIALGGGPPFVGWLIDWLAHWNFAHPGAHGVFTSLGGALGGAGGDFAHACPGGVAPKGAPAAAAALCRTTLAQSTRQGLVLQVVFDAWGALHYYLAAIGMAKQMRAHMDAPG